MIAVGCGVVLERAQAHVAIGEDGDVVQIAARAGDGLLHVVRTQERARAHEREAATGAIGRPGPARDHFEMLFWPGMPIPHVAAIEADGGIQVTPAIVRISIEDLRSRLPWL